MNIEIRLVMKIPVSGQFWFQNKVVICDPNNQLIVFLFIALHVYYPCGFCYCPVLDICVYQPCPNYSCGTVKCTHLIQSQPVYIICRCCPHAMCVWFCPATPCVADVYHPWVYYLRLLPRPATHVNGHQPWNKHIT